MATKMNRPVYRETEFAAVRSGGKSKPIIVGMIEGDIVELRLKGERKRIFINAATVYYHALALELARIKREKAATRKAKGLR